MENNSRPNQDNEVVPALEAWDALEEMVDALEAKVDYLDRRIGKAEARLEGLEEVVAEQQSKGTYSTAMK